MFDIESLFYAVGLCADFSILTGRIQRRAALVFSMQCCSQIRLGEIEIKKLNLWLTAPKEATPVK